MIRQHTGFFRLPNKKFNKGMRSSLFVIFLSVGICSAQKTFKAGILAGLVTSQVHGDTYSGFDKAGYLLGGFVKRELSEKWELKFEIDLLQKGSKKNMNPEKGDYDYYHLRLSYVEVPLMIRMKQKNWKLEAGMAYAALFKTKEETEYGDITGFFPFNKTDLSMLTGLSYVFNEKLEFNIRYTNSLVPVRRYYNGGRFDYNSWFYNLFNRGLYNNVLSFAFHYQI
jgi:hypothetical protein